MPLSKKRNRERMRKLRDPDYLTPDQLDVGKEVCLESPKRIKKVRKTPSSRQAGRSALKVAVISEPEGLSDDMIRALAAGAVMDDIPELLREKVEPPPPQLDDDGHFIPEV